MLDSYYADADHWLNFAHTRSFPRETIEFHLHNYYEIYFFIAGGVDYFIEKRVYPLKYGDLLLMNNHEIHKPTFRSQEVYERIVIHFEPELGRIFSTPKFNLLHCFLNRPKGEQNKINLGPSEVKELMEIFTRLEGLTVDPPVGSDTLKLSYLVEILVFINQVFF
ncbi:MAG TPA: AraC family ligand binding domain-containing protein [Bacillota bacterium]|nr:AraC family ligand binding domain-containing protein [Bacillota bacterium]